MSYFSIVLSQIIGFVIYLLIGMVAVRMHVDQAGDDGGAIQVNGVGRDVFGEDFAEQAVPHLESAGMEPEIGSKNSRILIKHGFSPFTE